MKYFIAAAAIGLISSPAFAAWASGGGQIHKDGQNPWFLENTRRVQYCVDIDEANFGVTASEAASEIRAALGDWTAAFAAANDDYYKAGELTPYGQVRMATQIFEEHPCSSIDLDLRFQLGRLTPKQKRLFDNPKEFIGIAVRTAYDKQALKGSGFVYLSPISGPLAPNHPRMHPNAWSTREKFALKVVLRHELGHVFGMDHQPDTVMDEKWPEIFVDLAFLDDLSQPAQQYLEHRYSIMRLFGLKKDWIVESCGQRNPVSSAYLFQRRYSDDACGRIILRGDQLTIEYKDSPLAAFEMVGSATFSGTHTNSSPATSVYLPAEQQVFTHLPTEARSLGRLFGESKNTSRKWQGFLRIEATGDLLPLQIESNESTSSGTILKDGRFENDVFFLE